MCFCVKSDDRRVVRSEITQIRQTLKTFIFHHTFRRRSGRFGRLWLGGFHSAICSAAIGAT